MARRIEANQPTIWRDDALPFVEARSIEDGRHLSYGKHFHEVFSIGAVVNGQSVYVNGRVKEAVGRGTAVIMNPGDVHSCNPAGDEAWSYRMLYIDVGWLGSIQRELGLLGEDRFKPFSTTSTREPAIFNAVSQLYEALVSRDASPLEKETASISLVAGLHGSLATHDRAGRMVNPRLARAVDFIRANYRNQIKLKEICDASRLSASYLVRAFKKRFDMTPHAYVTNCRVEYCREQLRKGQPLAQIASAAGFSDQAHLQRTFKRLAAATPGQFQRPR
jgi:AraC-like DNA-binding protein